MNKKHELFLKSLELIRELEKNLALLYSVHRLDEAAEVSYKLLAIMESIPKDTMYWSDYD